MVSGNIPPPVGTTLHMLYPVGFFLFFFSILPILQIVMLAKRWIARTLFACLDWLHIMTSFCLFSRKGLFTSSSTNRLIRSDLFKWWEHSVDIIPSRSIFEKKNILPCQYFSDVLTFQLLTFCLYSVI